MLTALLVEDRVEDRAVIEACLRGSAFSVTSTGRVSRARELLAAKQPAVVILDIALRGEDTWRFLPEVKRAGIPVVVVSTADERAKGAALGADAWAIKPVSREWLRDTVAHVVLFSRLRRVLLVDDEIAPRTLLRVMLEPHCAQVIEAANGQVGWSLLDGIGADLMIVDLAMPQMNGMELLRRMREHAFTAAIPVIVCTSQDLSAADREQLAALGASVLAKGDLTREGVLDAALHALAGAQRLVADAPQPALADLGAAS